MQGWYFSGNRNVVEYFGISVPNDILHFGVEIEFETSLSERDVLQRTRKLQKWGIFVEDSSVKGGEFVSIPLSEETFRTFVQECWDELAWLFSLTPYESEMTALHVHISKTVLGEEKINQICKKIWCLNPEENRDYFGRKANRFCQNGPNALGHLKYSNVNVLPEHTLEIRGFRTPRHCGDFLNKMRKVWLLTK